jgi:hypothetical protein
MAHEDDRIGRVIWAIVEFVVIGSIVQVLS